ncbi:MAG: ADP-ribosylglycohydrolase family protein, partial [Lentisphaerae bacterium]
MANHCFDWKQSDLDTEYAQASEEGRHMEALEAEFAAVRAIPEQTQTFQTAFDNLCDLVQQSKLHEEAAKNEPNDFEDIVALLPQPPSSQPPRIDSAFVDRIYGAWLGRCTGCLLGKPVEGWRSPRLHGMLQAGGWELPHDYLWNLELSDDQHEAFDTARIRSMGNSLTGMPEDDDINYTITGLAILKQHGFDFSTDHVGTFWLHHLPILHTWTAERVAYR